MATRHTHGRGGGDRGKDVLTGGKRRRRGWEPTAQEVALAATVFGPTLAAGGGRGGAGDGSTTTEPSHGRRDAGEWAASKAPVPAWRDEDEEGGGGAGGGGSEAGGTVALASVSRLRKLRQSVDDNVVTTAELERRLRQSHAALSGAGVPREAGVPHWSVADASLAAARKRRRAGGGDDSDDDSEAGAWEDEAAAAEATLLRGTTSLVAGRRRAGARARALAADAGGDGVEEGDGDDDGAVGAAGMPLPPGRLSVSRMRDLNRVDACKAVVQAVSFHSGGAVALTASLDHTLRFFRVDGKENDKIASVHLTDLPIASADWSADGAEVYASGRRPFWYSYDVETGVASRLTRVAGTSSERSLESAVVQREGGAGGMDPLVAFLADAGRVHLVSQRSKAWVSTVQMEGAVRAVTFLPHPATGFTDIITTGTHGQVYVWDARTFKCRVRHGDEGSTGSTAIAACSATGMYAIGSNMGIVNTYDSGSWAGNDVTATVSPTGTVASLFPTLSTTIRPTSVSSHLTTSVSQLALSRAGAIMAVASQRKQDSMKLIHTATGTAFSNWPTNRTPLNYVTAVAFSPSDGYLAIGNDKGRVLLYRLHHYHQA